MKILFLLILLIVFPLVYADQSITLDKPSYTTNDVITVSGNVNFQDRAFVIIQIRSPSDIVAIDQFTPPQNGSFSKTFVAQGPKWQEFGKYTVVVTYNGVKSENAFDFVSSPPEDPHVSIPVEKTPQLPPWAKSYAKKWHDGDIGDRQFLAGISELIKEKFVNVDEEYIHEDDSTRTIPNWFKNTALWYSQGMITDNDYFLALEFLIREEFLVI